VNGFAHLFPKMGEREGREKTQNHSKKNTKIQDETKQLLNTKGQKKLKSVTSQQGSQKMIKTNAWRCARACVVRGDVWHICG